MLTDGPYVQHVLFIIRSWSQSSCYFLFHPLPLLSLTRAPSLRLFLSSSFAVLYFRLMCLFVCVCTCCSKFLAPVISHVVSVYSASNGNCSLPKKKRPSRLPNSLLSLLFSSSLISSLLFLLILSSSFLLFNLPPPLHRHFFQSLPSLLFLLFLLQSPPPSLMWFFFSPLPMFIEDDKMALLLPANKENMLRLRK